MTGSILDPVFGWMLYMHPALSILLISLIVAIITTLAIKFLTDQRQMKTMRDNMNKLQKEMKEVKNNPKKLTKINTELMEINMKYMSHSMKPTLYTFIPILLVFGWLSAHLSYYQIMPGQDFTFTATFSNDASGDATLIVPPGIELLNNETQVVDKEAIWNLKGDAGTYNITMHYKNKDYVKEVLITKDWSYLPAEKDFRKSYFVYSAPDANGVNKVILGNKKVIPFENVPVMKDIPWVGGWSWFGVYLVFSLVFSMTLRKVLKVY